MKHTDWTLYDWVRNPPEVYEKMHRAGPIFWSDEYRGWLVVDYDLARELLKDTRLSSLTINTLKESTFPKRSRDKIEPLLDLYHSWLMFSDPPYHAALRKILNPFFTKTALENRAPSIEQHARSLLSKCQGEWDFMKDFASLLPMYVMADLMEMPYDKLDQFAKWNSELALFIEAVLRSPDITDQALEALQQEKKHFNKIISKASKDGFITHFCNEVANEKLLDKENCWQLLSMLLASGTETTHNLLGSGLFALLSNPEQYQLLQSKSELLDSAINECLRYYPPIQSVYRLAMENISIGDITIQEGHYVRIVIGAINRDPKHFENPNQLDITRDSTKQLSFGAGIHFCLGRMLAILVGQVVFPIILEQFPNLQLLTKQPEWVGGTTFLGIQSFLVK